MHDRIDVIEVGFVGPEGELSPADRAAVTAAIAAGDALASAMAEVTEAADAAAASVDAAASAAEAAQQARDAITGLQVATGPAGSAAAWDPETKTLTVPQGDQGGAGVSAYQTWLAAGNVGSEADFITSLKGDPGDKGAPGAPGQNGASAYQLAVAAGFAGTEAAWRASLKGDPGAPGAAGTSIVGVVLTQADYDRLTAGQKDDPTKLYLIAG